MGMFDPCLWLVAGMCGMVPTFFQWYPPVWSHDVYKRLLKGAQSLHLQVVGTDFDPSNNRRSV